jgi:predicted RND superfamily exporter protein
MAFLGGQDKVDNKCQEIVGTPGQPDSKNIIQDLLLLLKGDQVKVAGRLSQFQRHFAPKYQEVVIQMCNTDKISLDELPASILDQYANRERDKFMLTIYPRGNLFEDTEMMNRFYDSVSRVSDKTTGTPILGVALIDIFAQDGRNAILLTLGIVFILLWVDFGKPHYALFAMIPLAMGLFWMVGILNLSGFMLTFMTFTGLPLIIGIGIDDGVHIMHRWQYEGHNRIHTVFSSTGKAILLTSLTTMLAFGSMMFSVFPAWAWFGRDLTIGVGACFVTTVLILPGIFGLIEKLNEV